MNIPGNTGHRPATDRTLDNPGTETDTRQFGVKRARLIAASDGPPPGTSGPETKTDFPKFGKKVARLINPLRAPDPDPSLGWAQPARAASVPYTD